MTQTLKEGVYVTFDRKRKEGQKLVGTRKMADVIIEKMQAL